jgi:hypothetical protein
MMMRQGDASMSIRFINTTTRLPVDGEIENEFLETIHPAFRDAIKPWRPPHEANVDVFFVSERDLDLERERLEGETDVLGVYFPFHPEFHRPIIKVSPEKVWDACKSFPGTLPRVRRYHALLVKVVIHELAHWIMDPYPDELISEHWLKHDEPHFLNLSHIERVYSGTPRHPKWRRPRHFIEESLANAFVLKQKFSVQDLDFLKEFIADQPDGYKRGGLWSGDLDTTIETAQSWARFKRYGDDARWNFVFDEAGTPVEKIVGRLDEGQFIRSVDFVREFHQHLASRVGTWQSQYQASAPGSQQQEDWNTHLNDVFDELTSRADLTPPDRVAFLKQRAAHGSAQAVDELRKLHAGTAKATASCVPATAAPNQPFLTSRDDIDAWMGEYACECDYEIRPNGIVDVPDPDTVILYFKKPFDRFPIKFGIVNCAFTCSNLGLESLEGAPEDVRGNFFCDGNKLSSFDGAPRQVHGDFVATDNPVPRWDYSVGTIGGKLRVSENCLVTLRVIMMSKVTFCSPQPGIMLAQKLKEKGMSYTEIQGELADRGYYEVLS